MEKLSISIYAQLEKRHELLRACRSIMDQTRQDEDCKSSSLSQNSTNENIIVIEQTWSRWDAVKHYLQSDNFSVLLGAMKLLGKSYEIRINDSSQAEGLKVVESAREDKSFKALR